GSLGDDVTNQSGDRPIIEIEISNDLALLGSLAQELVKQCMRLNGEKYLREVTPKPDSLLVPDEISDILGKRHDNFPPAPTLASLTQHYLEVMPAVVSRHVWLGVFADCDGDLLQYFRRLLFGVIDLQTQHASFVLRMQRGLCRRHHKNDGTILDNLLSDDLAV